MRRDLPNIRPVCSTVCILRCLLAVFLGSRNVDTSRVRALYCPFEELESVAGEVWGFVQEFLEEGGCCVGGEEVVDYCTGGVGGYVFGGVEVEGPTFAGEELFLSLGFSWEWKVGVGFWGRF